MKFYKKKKFLDKAFILLFILVVAYFQDDIKKYFSSKEIVSYSLIDIPEYTNKKFIYLNDNVPNFKDSDLTTTSFEKYGELDELGRCTTAFANLGKDLMPNKERDYIGMIKPTGWQYSKYDFIEGEYLYNRCHLIAYQLSGENANPNNLITCTRSMNADVMNNFEIKVGNYIRKTNNHVLYRVTPIFKDNNLIATGVQIEALSVEDNGSGIKFNVFIYNVEDKVKINYLDGTNSLK